MKPFIDLTKAAVWRMRSAQNRPYLHKITFFDDGRWCFANAYEKHSCLVGRAA